MAKQNPARKRLKPTKVLIDLELGKCLTINTKKAHEVLHFIAHSCNLARNKVVRDWEAWRRENPDWQPQQRTGRGKMPKFINKKVPVKGTSKFAVQKIPKMEHPAISQEIENMLYHSAVSVSPHLHTNLTSKCKQEALVPIMAKAAWTDGGYKYERILSYEDRLPSFHGSVIPVQNADAILCYDGVTWAGGKVSDNSKAVTQKHSASCVFGIRLLRYPKANSDFAWPEQLPKKKQLEFLLFRLKIDDLHDGIKKKLKEIASFVAPPKTKDGKESKKLMKFGDSKLVFSGGKWRLQLLTTAHPSDPLDTSKVAILVPMPSGSFYPFVLHLPDGTTRKIGNQRGCTSCYRDRSIQFEHHKRLRCDRFRKGIGKGHGRARIFDERSRLTGKSRAYQKHFLQNVVIDAVREATRAGCGSVIYREPNLWLRQMMWNEVLAERIDKDTKRYTLVGLVLNSKGRQIHAPYNLPRNFSLCFDWTKFDGYLKYKMEQAGIYVTSSRIGYKEYNLFLTTGKITVGEKKGEKAKKNGEVSAKKQSANGSNCKTPARNGSANGAKKTSKKGPLAKSKIRRKGAKKGSRKPDNAPSASK